MIAEMRVYCFVGKANAISWKSCAADKQGRLPDSCKSLYGVVWGAQRFSIACAAVITPVNSSPDIIVSNGDSLKVPVYDRVKTRPSEDWSQ